MARGSVRGWKTLQPAARGALPSLFLGSLGVVRFRALLIVGLGCCTVGAKRIQEFTQSGFWDDKLSEAKGLKSDSRALGSCQGGARGPVLWPSGYAQMHLSIYSKYPQYVTCVDVCVCLYTQIYM